MNEIAENEIKIYQFPDSEGDEEEAAANKKLRVSPSSPPLPFSFFPSFIFIPSSPPPSLLLPSFLPFSSLLPSPSLTSLLPPSLLPPLSPGCDTICSGGQ